MGIPVIVCLIVELRLNVSSDDSVSSVSFRKEQIRAQMGEAQIDCVITEKIPAPFDYVLSSESFRG